MHFQMAAPGLRHKASMSPPVYVEEVLEDLETDFQTSLNELKALLISGGEGREEVSGTAGVAVTHHKLAPTVITIGCAG